MKMQTLNQYWNPKQKLLKTLLSKKATAEEGLAETIKLHQELHSLTRKSNNLYTELINEVKDIYSFQPNSYFYTVAWNIWHITRIEDAIINILIFNKEQVFTEEWKKLLNIKITDTGNALNVVENKKFSDVINFNELLKYRKKVGLTTQKLLPQITVSMLRNKPNEQQIKRLFIEKVLTKESESSWLSDFWAKRTVTGFLLLPITRHQIYHMNDCIKIQSKYLKEKRPTPAST